MSGTGDGASLATLFSSVTNKSGLGVLGFLRRKKIHGFYMHYDSHENELSSFIKITIPGAKIINIDDDVYTVMDEATKANFKSMEIENPEAFENLITPMKQKYVNMILKYFGKQAPVVCVISHDLSFLKYLSLKAKNMHCLVPDEDLFESMSPSDIGQKTRRITYRQKEVEAIEYTSVENMKKHVKYALGLKKKKK
jgi:hypothetical protein